MSAGMKVKLVNTFLEGNLKVLIPTDPENLLLGIPPKQCRPWLDFQPSACSSDSREICGRHSRVTDHALVIPCLWGRKRKGTLRQG